MKLKPFPESIVVHRWKEKGVSIGIQLSKTAWSFVGWWFELRWEIGQSRGKIKKNLLAFIAKGILCASHLFKLQEHSMSKNFYYCLLESKNPTQSFFWVIFASCLECTCQTCTWQKRSSEQFCMCHSLFYIFLLTLDY